jgi:MFS family permease
MNLDDLKTQWRVEMEQASPPYDLRFEGIKRDVSEANRSVQFGNFWTIFGLIAGSALAVFFGWIAMDGVGWRQKLSIGTFVLVTAWVILMLLRARRVSRSDDWTLRSRLQIEIERLEKQRTLWSYGGVWFWGPMSVPVLLGLPVRLDWVWFLLCAFLYWIVHHWMRKSVDPLLSRLKALHRELVEGD